MYHRVDIHSCVFVQVYSVLSDQWELAPHRRMYPRVCNVMYPILGYPPSRDNESNVLDPV